MFENEDTFFDRNDVFESHDSIEELNPVSSGFGTHITFGSREDMQPYDDTGSTNLIQRARDPFGAYSLRNFGYDTVDDFLPKPELSEDFTGEELQQACDTICDVLDIRHIPVFVTKEVPNAAFSPGLFKSAMWDDQLFLNPDYASSCIENVGTTDIVLSDMAHEIGHAIVTKYCGINGTYLDEKMADFVSGFVNCKLGVDIDSARKWFMWQYDPVGEGGYPVSEERWDIESAGYYFAHFADAEALKSALQDEVFLNIVREYNSSNAEEIATEVWQEDPFGTQKGISSALAKFVSQIKEYFHIS